MAVFVIVGMLDFTMPFAVAVNTDEDQLNNERTMAKFTHNMNAHAIMVITNFLSASMIWSNTGKKSNHLSDFFAVHVKTAKGYNISAMQKSNIAWIISKDINKLAETNADTNNPPVIRFNTPSMACGNKDIKLRNPDFIKSIPYLIT